jgi:predicted Zn-dependent protease with MMP-like domain
MEDKEFEQVVAELFDRLPDKFREAIENLGVVVEDYPGEDLVRSLRLRSKHDLLGLYQGIPLTARGSWYGSHPVTPDTITLYKKNIESRVRSEEELRERIYEVLVHEVGHYFGMSEEEIRGAGY